MPLKSIVAVSLFMRPQPLATLTVAGLVLLGTATLVVAPVGAGPERRHVQIPSGAEAEIRQVEARINQIESESLKRARIGSMDPAEEVTLHGKLLLFDQALSVNRHEACAFCHMPETGFTAPVGALNAPPLSYPASVRTPF